MADVRDKVKSIKVDSVIDNLAQVESFIDEICLELNVREESYGNVLIAATEAFNNAVQHGNESNPEKQVQVQAYAENSTMKLVVLDEGEGFDFNNLPDPTAPENIEKENGRGVFLMKSLADKVEFEKKGSEVILSFKL
mgnify:CR=1 FL=1